MNIEPGTRIGKYKIQSLLGEGGMGSVYLALDTELNRPAALKFLPPEFTADERRVNRFTQEARAASALNHPNILTVYDIGQTEDGRRFFAAEFVDGATLREHVAAHAPKLGGLLDVAIQVASALVAAHEAGVVHRDIKPENVMVRRDGYVKVLDFGLAKLSERAPVDAEAATQALVNTDPGAVMGTVYYMSPEQARGRPVDARTDVWSLGVVLYETLAGRLPFFGRTPGHTLVAIQDEEPPPLARFAPDAPAALQELLDDALSKDADARPTAKQLLARLKRLRLRLESGEPHEHSDAPHAAGDDSPRAGAAPTLAALHTTAQPAPPGTVPTAAPRAGRRPGVWAALLAAALAAAVFAAYRYTRRDEAPKPAAGQMKITRLTTTGQASDAEVSPDGKYVVHVKTEGGRQSLWLRHVETASDTQIVAPTDDVLTGLTFARDGAYIYFTRGELNSAGRALYQVPLLGGTPRKVTESLASRVALSRDGRRMAFRRVRLPGESLLYVADANGGSERIVSVRKMPNLYGVGPAWSPDGKAVALGALNVEAADTYATLVEVEVETGAERRLTPERWSNIGQVEWLPDKSGLVLTATAEGTLESQIWHVAYPGGEVRRVTNDLNNYARLSLTADAAALVTVQSEGETNVWVAPAGEAARARQITTGRANSGRDGLSWTPDGRLIYTTREGVAHLWIAGADGSGARRLTERTRSNTSPAVTPDGRHVVFRSLRSGAWNVWRMDLDGGNARQLTTGATDNHPRLSPDGRWVVFTSNRAGLQNLWRVSVDGGEPVRLTERNTYNASVSPDGKLIASHYREGPDVPMRIAVIPFEGGEPVRLLDFSQKFVGPPGVRWSPDGRSLIYAETQGGVSNIWSLPLDGGPPRQLTDFETDEIFYFDYSPDGRHLAVSRGQITNDVVLITDFR